MKRLIRNKHTRLVLKHILGWFCIILGVIQGFLPFLQGWIFVAMGVFLLADHIPFFGRIRNWIQHRFPELTRRVHETTERIREKYRERRHKK